MCRIYPISNRCRDPPICRPASERRLPDFALTDFKQDSRQKGFEKSPIGQQKSYAAVIQKYGTRYPLHLSGVFQVFKGQAILFPFRRSIYNTVIESSFYNSKRPHRNNRRQIPPSRETEYFSKQSLLVNPYFT